MLTLFLLLFSPSVQTICYMLELCLIEPIYMQLDLHSHLSLLQLSEALMNTVKQAPFQLS